jgi:hypothetical protein
MRRIGLRIFPVTAILIASAADAEIPVFAAKCPTGITEDSNEKGQVYVNGQVAKVIKRPDGQISANSRGVWVDIKPQSGCGRSCSMRQIRIPRSWWSRTLLRSKAPPGTKVRSRRRITCPGSPGRPPGPGTTGPGGAWQLGGVTASDTFSAN